MFCTNPNENLAPIKLVTPTKTEMPSTHKENGSATPGMVIGGPIFTAALAVPNCKVPPKKFTPELTSVPGLKPSEANVSFDVSKGLQRIFGQSIVVILAML